MAGNEVVGPSCEGDGDVGMVQAVAFQKWWAGDVGYRSAERKVSVSGCARASHVHPTGAIRCEKAGQIP
jgi:hypothetical protein